MKIQLTIWWCWIIIYIALNSFMYAKELRVMKLVEGLHKPVYLTAPENNSDTLFIVEQHGVVQRLINGEVALSPLLNICHQVHQPKMPGDERGLLGFALHPQFSKNGRIFVNYVNKEDSTVISEYEVDPKTIIANAKKEKIILKFQQPYSNHNGGQLAFGPDGFLYIAVGDGGYAGDPHDNGQNIETIFGTILRIDVDRTPPYEIPVDNPFLNEKRAKGEIWCYGLRNAWRFSFDAETGDLYIGDVGQSSWEEIDYLPAISPGANFGWNKMEGAHCYPPGEDCEKEGLVLPIFEYPNNANYMKTLIGWDQNDAQGCSVTGGYVYRGSQIPELYGHYIFGDYCTGKVWSFTVKNGASQNYEEWKINGLEEDLYLSSFGEDGKGELYIVNHTGSIYKLVGVE